MPLENNIAQAFNATLGRIREGGFDALGIEEFLSLHQQLPLKTMPGLGAVLHNSSAEYWLLFPQGVNHFYSGNPPHNIQIQEFIQVKYLKRESLSDEGDESPYDISLRFYPGLLAPIINPRGEVASGDLRRRWKHSHDDYFISATPEGAMLVSFYDSGSGYYVPDAIQKASDAWVDSKNPEEEYPCSMLIKVYVREDNNKEREAYVTSIKMPNLLLGRGDLTSFIRHMGFEL